MSRLILVLALVAIVCPGCWNKDFQEPGRIDVEKRDTEAVLKANFQRVWAATQAALAKFPMLRKDADPDTAKAYVITDWIRGKSDVLYRGYDVNRIPYVIRYKFFIYVIGDTKSNMTKISVRSIEQYLDDSVTAGVDLQGGIFTWIKTDSSTLKESALIEQINKLALDPMFKVEN